MNKDIENIINIIGLALIVGLLLRYYVETGSLIEKGTQGFATVFDTVSLQNAPRTGG